MLRVAAIALDRGRVLLNRADGESVWYLPGGRIELMEPSREGLRRELREELGMEVAVGRLVWVVENFFELDGREIHELGLYYRVRLPRVVSERDEFYADDELGRRLEFRWYPTSELGDLPLHPSFLRVALAALPSRPTGVVESTRSRGHA